VGNQAGILKIYAPDRKSVLFTKDEPGMDMRGIDGILWAPLTDAHRRAIFGALEIGDDELDRVAGKLIGDFSALPHRETIALLGVLGSDQRVAPTQVTEIRRF